MTHQRKHNVLTAIIAMSPMWLIAFAASLILSDCSGETQTNMPRQKAYPRIATHDSTFTALASNPIHFEISTAAEVTLDSINTSKVTGENSRWINISYKGYNAVIYYTFTPVDATTINNVLANRDERMALNAGDNPSELTRITNANGFSSRILTTTQSVVTPIQFISTDGKDWVVSGAVHLSGMYTADTDSLSPVINVLRRDIIHSLTTIKK